jgi:hypothetical protein
MRIIPHNKQDWERFGFFLAKAYFVLCPITVVISMIVSISYPHQVRRIFTYQVRQEIEKLGVVEFFLAAFLVCFITMISVTLIQYFRNQLRPAITNALIIAGVIIFWRICLPLITDDK